MHEMWGRLSLLAMFKRGLMKSERFLIFANFAIVQTLNMFSWHSFMTSNIPQMMGNVHNYLLPRPACLRHLDLTNHNLSV